MATETKAPRATGKTGKTIAYTGLGLGVLAGGYYLYKHYQATGSLNPLSSGTTGTTSGTTSPTTTTTTTDTTPVTSAPTTLAEWKTAILAAMVATGIKGGENTAATGLASALSGHCVGPNEYAALNSALATVGQPPGSNLLVLSLCKTAPKATTATPKATAHATTTSTAAAAAAAKKVTTNRAAHNPLTKLKLTIGKK